VYDLSCMYAVRRVHLLHCVDAIVRVLCLVGCIPTVLSTCLKCISVYVVIVFSWLLFNGVVYYYVVRAVCGTVMGCTSCRV